MDYYSRLARFVFISSVIPSEHRGTDVESYPNRPIRFIVPFVAGGPGEILARLLGEKLTEHWGQPVLVDFKPGMNGIVGSELVSKAVPDGYTIAIAASAHYINPSIYRNLPFDPVNDFAAVSLITSSPLVLVVHPSVPANSFAELISFAKSHPGQLKYASASAGSPSHLAGELLNIMARVAITHVPYQGHAAAGAALTEGREVQLMYDGVFTSTPHIKRGEWKALAVTTAKRATAFPDVPTIAECGLAGYAVNPGMGVLAPAGTPKEIIDRLSNEIARILHLPEINARIRSDGAEPVGNTPEQFAAYIKAEIDKWAKAVKSAGIEIKDYRK